MQNRFSWLKRAFPWILGLVVAAISIGFSVRSWIEVQAYVATDPRFLLPRSSVRWGGLKIFLLRNWRFDDRDPDMLVLHMVGQKSIWIKLSRTDTNLKYSQVGTPGFAGLVKSSERLENVPEVFVTGTLKGNRIVYAWGAVDQSIILYGYFMTPTRTYAITCKYPNSRVPNSGQFQLESWTMVSGIEEFLIYEPSKEALNTAPLDRQGYSVFAGPMPTQGTKL